MAGAISIDFWLILLCRERRNFIRFHIKLYSFLKNLSLRFILKNILKIVQLLQSKYFY